MQHRILIADIGGTNSRFAHFILHKGELSLQSCAVFPTSTLHSMQDMARCAATTGIEPQQADIHIWGVAGHVSPDGRQATLTNGHVHFDIGQWLSSSRGTHTSYRLVNDFVLQACAGMALEENIPREKAQKNTVSCSVKTLVPPALGIHSQRGVRVTVGAGTGLGMGVFVPRTAKTERGFSVLSTEGGHVDFAFCGQEEQSYAAFMYEELGIRHVTAEEILAARGLSSLYHFMYGTPCAPQDVAALWRTSAAWKKEERTRALYARFLGRFCRHTVLNTLCTGGLYLGGGVLAKNPTIFESPAFLEEFYGNAAVHSVLKSVPIYVLLHEYAGLWGGAYMAKMLLEGEKVEIF